MPGALWRSRARVALPRALSRATKTIRAPILASSIAATSPIPDVPPVMTTVFPLISVSVITSLSQGCCLKTAVLQYMPNIPQDASDRFGQATKIDPYIACRRAGEARKQHSTSAVSGSNFRPASLRIASHCIVRCRRSMSISIGAPPVNFGAPQTDITEEASCLAGATHLSSALVFIFQHSKLDVSST